jgi:2-keto-3-deoxy-L-rhamnonate aldolase RhmA
MVKMMMKGEKVTSGTVFSTDSPATYCAMANARYDFIRIEMQHDSRDWEAVGRMWKACPHANAVPGVRVAYTAERELQHATDLGALVIVIPTFAPWKKEEPRGTWTNVPPLGKGSQGGGQAFDPDMWGSVPGGYRNNQPKHRADRNDRDARRREGRT